MSNTKFKFTLQHQDGSARAGVFETAHGETLTPVFMPVATRAVLRGHDTAAIAHLGFKTLLANTYHLLLRPGPDVFEAAGGIHPFMQWTGSVLTDSGGFQIFSLAHALRLSEEGAEFRSYVDGKKILLTPERSIATQRAINSDIMMALDQCVPALSDHATSLAALELSFRWAKRSYEARGDAAQALFGIVQGACFDDLRALSASQITSIPFDGYAIGGVAVGEEKTRRDEVIAFTAPLLPQEKPRYLMGVGTPLDILEAVSRGVDMFDCIMPTAYAQQGVCFTSKGKIDLNRGVYRLSQEPLDSDCACETCRKFTRSYLHHLTKSGEYQGATLLGVHNLSFYYRLMCDIRSAIVAGEFATYYARERKILGEADPEFPSITPKQRAKNKLSSKGDFEIVERGETFSIRQISSGEVMHPCDDPIKESEALYIEQPDFIRRIADLTAGELVVWDVGLGAGYNAMAAIRAYEKEAQHLQLVPLKIISFEIDLDAFALVIEEKDRFHHVRHPAPHAVLNRAAWKSSKLAIDWQLVKGDFLHEVAREDLLSPELIFFDPFSSKADAPLWTVDAFRKIRSRCRENSTQLISYTASTSIRTAMLVAGFYVAKGVALPPKIETTIALSISNGDADSRYQLLGNEWLLRRARSQNRYPLGSDETSKIQIDKAVLAHPQFRNLA